MALLTRVNVPAKPGGILISQANLFFNQAQLKAHSVKKLKELGAYTCKQSLACRLE